MKTKLLLILIVALFAAATQIVRAQPVPDVAWWDFSRVTNNVVFDAAGNGHHASVEGPRSVPDVTLDGEIDRWVIDFDGMNWLRVADSDALDLVGDWTIAFWTRPGELFNGVERWIYKQAGFHDAEGGYAIDAHQLPSLETGVGAVTYGSPNRVTDFGVVEPGRWNHVAVTYNSADFEAATFINGVRVGSGFLGPMLANVYPMIIGADLLPDGVNINPEYRSHGSMADIRIYSRILSDSEVIALVARPSQCEQQLEEALSAITNLQAANAVLAAELQACQAALAAERTEFQQFRQTIDEGLEQVGTSLNAHDRDFVIPGATTQEKFKNLAEAIVDSSRGARMQLYRLLTPRRH